MRVVYKGQELPGAPKLDVAALTAAARAAIASSSGVPVREDGGTDSTRPRRYGCASSSRSAPPRIPSPRRATCARSCRRGCRPSAASRRALSFEQSALAERAYTPGKPGEPAWQAHAERAVRDCVGGVGARVKLAAGDVGAIVAAIDGPDDDLRDEAIRLAGERKESAAVPALVKRLKSDDHAVRDRAIGALAAIGDPRAVRPLTEVAKFNELSDLPKVLDALATIGGDEARSYLEFVASGHDNPEMRDLAKEALTHLDRRQAEKNRDMSH